MAKSSLAPSIRWWLDELSLEPLECLSISVVSEIGDESSTFLKSGCSLCICAQMEKHQFTVSQSKEQNNEVAEAKNSRQHQARQKAAVRNYSSQHSSCKNCTTQLLLCETWSTIDAGICTQIDSIVPLPARSHVIWTFGFCSVRIVASFGGLVSPPLDLTLWA